MPVILMGETHTGRLPMLRERATMLATMNVLAQIGPRDNEQWPWGWVGLGLLCLVLLLVLIWVGKVFGLWIQALFAGAKVTLRELIGMRLRKVDSRQIVLSKIQAVRRAGRPDQPSRKPLPGRRARAASGRGADCLRPREHPADVEDGHGHRPGRARHPRCRADLGQSQGHRLPQPGQRTRRPSTRWPRMAFSSRPRHE